MDDFAQKLLAWYDQHGRRDLPWKQSMTPYRVWLAEIMLQQTQVKTVRDYFLRFTERFPDLHTLADAPLDAVLTQWAGLGYYARARNLHRAAQWIHDHHGGVFPQDFQQVIALPGIGRSTAGAILAQAFNQRWPILEGNVKRVLSRFHEIEGYSGEPAVETTLWALADRHTPSERVADYTQAIMDLGATLCTRAPQCIACPQQSECGAFRHQRVTALPVPKPKKVLPTRHTTLLLIEQANDAIWLERRPEKGIWGGLWSLPEVATDDDDPTQTWQQKLGVVLISKQKWARLRHSFTHFHLEMEVERWQVSRLENETVEESTGLWYDPKTLAAVALAAPIQKLLALRMIER